MSVKHVLALAGATIGQNPSDPGQRNVLLRFLNEAAFECYNQADMPGTLMEMCFKVNGDQEIALPQYVGHVRAVRELASMVTWNLSQMRPRYNMANWNDFWRNWRIKNRSPLQQTISNLTPLVITVPTVDTPPITVSITGQTAIATQITEIVTMSSTSVQTVNTFLDVKLIAKSGITTYDVTVSDVDGNAISNIPSNEYEAWFQLVDVSTMPWLATSTSSQDHFVEVLYKQKLRYLSNDGDEFPANDCDHILANKMLQIWYQEQGKADVALGYDQLVTRSMARLVEEANRGTQDKVGFAYCGHDSLSPRIRARRPYRSGGYGATAYVGTGAM